MLLLADRPPPQPRTTTIKFTATATGGVAPYQYKWYIYNGLSWASPTGWTTASTFTWSPGDENPNYEIGVWVKSAGNAADALESSAQMSFPTTALPPPTVAPAPAPATKVSSVALTPNVTTAVAGSTVLWTAVPSGGVAPQQYKWWVYDGAAWVAATGWTTSNTYAWVPKAINPNYRVGVWVRSAGATADALEASREAAFPISR